MFEDDFKNENYEGDDAGIDELISTYENAINENQSIHLDHDFSFLVVGCRLGTSFDELQ